VKRRDLMKKLAAEARAQGRELILAEGSNHTKVSIGETQAVVPRHKEINEITARAILRQMGVGR
jgi:mRNA interferase HicA